jgi:nicotinate-nucleotide pyrophosphorylase
MTAYEAAGMAQAEEDGADLLVKVEVETEKELREAIAAGAGAVLLRKVNKVAARRLCELAKRLRAEAGVGS